MKDRSIDEFVDTGDDGGSASSADQGETDQNADQPDDDTDGGGTSGAVADDRSALEGGAEGADDERLKPQDGAEAESADGGGAAEDRLKPQDGSEAENVDGGTAAESQDGSGRAPGDLEPPTAAWTPAGEVCASCGESVERRWRGSAGLVCPDCKEW